MMQMEIFQRPNLNNFDVKSLDSSIIHLSSKKFILLIFQLPKVELIAITMKLLMILMHSLCISIC